MFYLTAHTAEQNLQAQLDELYEVRWMSPEELGKDDRTSLMILELLDLKLQAKPIKLDELEDDNVFGYTAYKLFF